MKYIEGKWSRDVTCKSLKQKEEEVEEGILVFIWTEKPFCVCVFFLK